MPSVVRAMPNWYLVLSECVCQERLQGKDGHCLLWRMEMYSKYMFDEFAHHVMQNWEAIHECEDERDADRLLKRAAAAAKGHRDILEKKLSA